MSENQTIGRKRKMIDNLALLECTKELCLDLETADAYFVIESERVPVHKIFLGAVSDVFKAMFYGELKEIGDVELNDVSLDAFKIFLKFFYLGQVELTDEYIAELMHLGHKYNIVKCVEACVQFLKETLNDENVCTGLNLAFFYDHTDLLELCTNHITLNTESVFKSSNFLECNKKVLEYILQMDKLSCLEADVFEACMSWVKAKSKKDILTREMVQTHLGDLFYEIRFKSMTMQELAALANTYDSILSTELRNIINVFLPEFPVTRYTKKRRQVTWDESDIITCDRAIVGSERKYFSLLVEEYTTFSSNKPLLLNGFICEEIFSTQGNDKKLISDLSIEVTITEMTITEMTITEMTDGKVDKIISKLKTNLRSKGSEVLLRTAVLIRPGFKYRIRLSKFPIEHRHYSKSLLAEVKIDSDVTITFHEDGVVENEIISLISALKFN